ncbi:universal stress protein [Blastococcus saxobsidens]|uniref:Universal stress protein n=1 Tax=Blastococcus saxobsidens TaxID=138336 RepID=A0A6L9W0H5_9ACTN|nr:universal stress protein [Blastococcus saxobsidens]NEK85597.1 universal stress protein [Blastococcus saxobsidens]
MTIVVGYVPTAEGEAALTAAIAEARRRAEPLHVLNTSRGDAYVDNRLLSEELLVALREQLGATGVDYEVEQRVRGHEAAEELVETADRVQASLIVIGIRRRTATGKLLTGSQAQRILLDANCPVLAVKAG